MTAMVSKKTLKVSLLCLLGFTVFCLIVLEVVLNDRELLTTGSALGKKYTAFFTRDLNSSGPAQRGTLSHADTALKLAANVSHAPSGGDAGPANLSTAAIPEKAASSANSSASSSGGTKTLGQSTAAQGNPATKQPSDVLDYCALSSSSPQQTGFRREKQLTPHGTRPVNCSGCFNSDFPALIDGCGVCNAGVGGKQKVVDIIMVILTTHKATDKRQAIRETWASVTANNTANIRRVFLFGRVQDEKDMDIVRQESARFGDIIMYDFMDSYANLTLKTLTAMHWTTRFCGHARFLLKVDDDMWVNVPALLTTVNRENGTLQTAVGGACHLKAGPIRNPASKWYASVKAYPQKSYPGFCSGTSYVTSLNVARNVLSVSPNVPFFYLEDVYVSLCIKRLGAPFRLKPLPGFFAGGTLCKMRGPGVVTAHQIPPNRLKAIWDAKC